MRLPAFAIAFALPLAAQDQADLQVRADTDTAVERFRQLDFRHKAAIVRTVQRQLGQLEDPALRRIAALRIDEDALIEGPEAAPIFDPRRFAGEQHASGRAPLRRVVEPDAAEFAEVAQRFARAPFLPDLHTEVRYDWSTGQIVACAPLGYVEIFENAVRGWAPGSSHAVARITRALDRDPEQRKLGAWFAHAYCDLQARAFPPITLYDAWYSGEIVDVPDVDAIPFAWNILGWKRYRSPLSGPPRDRLYQAIRQAALRHRIHRTQCEAAAAAVVRAEPVMDPTYARLVPRFHYLWATLGDDPERVAEKLRDDDRDAILAEVDTRIRESSGTAFEVREGRRAELAAMQAKVTAIALAALDRIGG